LLLVAINDVAAFLLGAAFIAAAVVAWRQANATYKIFFGTAAGEQSALESKDGDFVERAARAIDDALTAGR